MLLSFLSISCSFGIFGIPTVSLLIFRGPAGVLHRMANACRSKDFLMTNFVFIVPKQTLNDLLVSWLRLSDVGKLDAALCDRVCRDVFEHSLALRNFRHAADMHCASLEFISWVIKRKIKLDALLIGSNLLRRKNEKMRLQLLEIVGPTLRSAVINAGEDLAFNRAYFTECLKYDDPNSETDSSSESDSDSSSNSSSDSSSDSSSESDSDSDTSCRGERRNVAAQDDNHATEKMIIDEVIVDLSLHCTKLETFAVRGHHSASVVSLLQTNPKLDTITLNNSPKVLRYISSLCADISCISIAEGASPLDIERFALNAPLKLKKLCLPDTDIKSSVLKPLLQRASLLELRIGSVRCKWAGMSIVCPNLQLFQCTVPFGTDKIDLIMQLATIMPNLRTLALPFTDGDWRAVTILVETVLSNFLALRQLCTARGCEDKLSALNEDAVQAGHSQPLTGFQLEELFSNQLGYLDVKNTLSKCPRLHTLGMGSTNRENTAITRCAVPSVQKVVISSMNNVVAEGYRKFCNLDALDLAGCTYLTNKELACIANNCPELSWLHIQDAPRVTLGGALTVLKLCPRMQNLEIGCKHWNGTHAKSNSVAAVIELCMSKYAQLQHMLLCLKGVK